MQRELLGLLEGAKGEDMSSELEQVSEAEEYTGLQTWSQLRSDADEIMGYDHAKDELLDALVGVPHLITSLTFRPGITRKVSDGKQVVDKQFAYVSCEARLAMSQTQLDLANAAEVRAGRPMLQNVPVMRLPKINMARKTADLEPLRELSDLPFDPDGHVIYNDGSTGIYRQIVQYLAAKGYVSLVKEGETVVTNGRLGETTLDLPPGDWADIHAGHMRFDETGFGLYSVHVRLMCPRGLRLSEYTNEFNPDGSKTRYLA